MLVPLLKPLVIAAGVLGSAADLRRENRPGESRFVGWPNASSSGGRGLRGSAPDVGAERRRQIRDVDVTDASRRFFPNGEPDPRESIQEVLPQRRADVTALLKSTSTTATTPPSFVADKKETGARANSFIKPHIVDRLEKKEESLNADQIPTGVQQQVLTGHTDVVNGATVLNPQRGLYLMSLILGGSWVISLP